MEDLKTAFEEVADWCEKHLEDQRGREIGLTFGAMLRAYGRLATLSSRSHGEQLAAKERELNARAEELLTALSIRFLVACGWTESQPTPVDSTSMRTNMIYDTGPRQQQ